MHAPSYELLTSEQGLIDLVFSLVEARKPIGFDIETGYDGESHEGWSLHPEVNFVVSFQFTNSEHWARMVPLRFDQSGVNMDNTTAAACFWVMLNATDDEGLPLGVAHGGKFERRVLARWFLRWLARHPVLGKAVRKAHGYFPLRSCTLLEVYSEGSSRQNGLKEITEQPAPVGYGYKMRELLSLFNKPGVKPLTEKEERSIRFNVLSPDDPEVVAYGCEDAIYALKHHLDRWPRVRNHPIYQLEMAVLLEVVCDMEDTGIEYDWLMMREGARQAREFAHLYRAEVLAGLSALAGEPVDINLNSPPQLREVLYAKCGMPVHRWTDGGKSGKKQPSTDAKTALKPLALTYPEVARFLNWKGLVKLYTTYLDIYPRKFSYSPDGRTHPSLIQHGAKTGRTSAADPPYQQSPKRSYHYALSDGTSFDFKFRDCIVAPHAIEPWWQTMLIDMGLASPVSDPGWYILGFDYSQIELRVYAAEAGEQALIEAFQRGDDVHTLTAALMLGIPADQVSKEERDVGKTMNFALAYGMTEDGLADRLGITRDEAVDLFTQYHAAYPRLHEWSQRTIAQSRQTGCVWTKFGRKVRIWEYDSDSPRIRRDAERTAGNAPIQGSSTGDYKKLAMVRAARALRKAGLEDRVRLVMDVHDALEWYVQYGTDPVEVIQVLQDAVVFDVEGWLPMVAEWHIGERWGSVLKLEQNEHGEWKVEQPEEQAVTQESTGDEDEDVPVGNLASWTGGGHEGQDVHGNRYPAGLAGHQLAAGGAGPGSHGPGPDSHRVVPGEPSPPRQVNIAVLTPPTQQQAVTLSLMLQQLPGDNSVKLVLPDGQTVDIRFRCGLTPQHEPEVALVLGGAMVYYDESDIDVDALRRGLTL